MLGGGKQVKQGSQWNKQADTQSGAKLACSGNESALKPIDTFKELQKKKTKALAFSGKT